MVYVRLLQNTQSQLYTERYRRNLIWEVLPLRHCSTHHKGGGRPTLSFLSHSLSLCLTNHLWIFFIFMDNFSASSIVIFLRCYFLQITSRYVCLLLHSNLWIFTLTSLPANSPKKNHQQVCLLASSLCYTLWTTFPFISFAFLLQFLHPPTLPSGLFFY